MSTCLQEEKEKLVLEAAENKRQLQEMILYPIDHPEKFEKFGMTPSKVRGLDRSHQRITPDIIVLNNSWCDALARSNTTSKNE